MDLLRELLFTLWDRHWLRKNRHKELKQDNQRKGWSRWWYSRSLSSLLRSELRLILPKTSIPYVDLALKEPLNFKISSHENSLSSTTRWKCSKHPPIMWRSQTSLTNTGLQIMTITLYKYKTLRDQLKTINPKLARHSHALITTPRRKKTRFKLMKVKLTPNVKACTKKNS